MNMIEREIAPRLKALSAQYPIVTVTGPRQSGKTTLCRETFPGMSYANLESPDLREFAELDPRGFLAQLGEGAIIDEIQRVPGLLSYLPVIVDQRRSHGLYILTGSEQFLLSDAISQSLAGRTALLRLLPFSVSERRKIGGTAEIDQLIFAGFYPRILDEGLEPRQALADYFETYIERDVRRLGGVRDLSTFRRFVQLCAGRVGQVTNLSSLGADVGVTHTTAREWLTILERSYVIFQLPPFHANIGKRLIRSPKLYFYDVGLASYLIGIERSDQVATHPLRGSLFENLIVTEAIKHRLNRGAEPRLWFFRDKSGLECDLLYETSAATCAIEVKSGATVSSDSFASIDRVAGLIGDVTAKAIVYGGSTRQTRSGCEVLPLVAFADYLERFEVDQEFSRFVADRSTSEDDQSEMEIIDLICQRLIRPTLNDIESLCRELGSELFRRHGENTFVDMGTTSLGGGMLFDSRTWTASTRDYISGHLIELADDRPIELGQRWSLQNYKGAGYSGFDLNMRIVWKLAKDKAIREMTVDGVPISRLDLTVPYSTLGLADPDSDLVVAEVKRALMSRIDHLRSQEE